MVWLANRTSWAAFAQPGVVLEDRAADLSNADYDCPGLSLPGRGPFTEGSSRLMNQRVEPSRKECTPRLNRYGRFLARPTLSALPKSAALAQQSLRTVHLSP